MLYNSFTLKMKSQSIAYLLNGSEHIYWILALEGKVHSTWDLWTITKAMVFSKSGGQA